MNKIKVFLASDGQGWICDRLAQRMIEGIPEIDFTLAYYTRFNSGDLIKASEEHDIVHYFNWDIARHSDALPQLKCPLIMSVRSHRYAGYVPELSKYAKVIHAITPLIQKEFPESVYIPDPIFDDLLPHKEFTVGFAGQDSEYKGNRMIEEACRNLGVKFLPAYGEIKPEDMKDWWNQVDLYVCASQQEGHSTPIMEAMAMNKPFITTRVGLPSTLDLPEDCYIDRSVDGIEQGIKRHYMRPKVLPEFSWERVNQQFKELYNEVYGSKT